jgi:hypothetical protein
VQLVRTGWYREARVKGWAAPLIRRLVGARARMVGISIDLSNQIRSTLKTFGLRASGGAGRAFEAKIHTALEGRPEVAGSLSLCLPPGAPCATRLLFSTSGSSRPPRRINLPAVDDLSRRWGCRGRELRGSR